MVWRSHMLGGFISQIAKDTATHMHMYVYCAEVPTYAHQVHHSNVWHVVLNHSPQDHMSSHNTHFTTVYLLIQWLEEISFRNWNFIHISTGEYLDRHRAMQVGPTTILIHGTYPWALRTLHNTTMSVNPWANSSSTTEYALTPASNYTCIYLLAVHPTWGL